MKLKKLILLTLLLATTGLVFVNDKKAASGNAGCTF